MRNRQECQDAASQFSTNVYGVNIWFDKIENATNRPKGCYMKISSGSTRRVIIWNSHPKGKIEAYKTLPICTTGNDLMIIE